MILGWQWLLARDAAWLTLLVPLVAPHDWRVGLGAGITALMVGHGASLCPAPPRRRGHFLQGPSLGLGVLQTILMAAVSLAVSTRLGMVPNLIICFTVYALGHLVPLIVQSSVGKFAIVRFVGKLIATLLPVLDHFTIEAAGVGGMPVPRVYLGWAALYAALYSTLAILVALVLFQDRDLA